MAESSRIEELKRRVQLDPASIAFAALAEEYRRAGQFDDAIATCQAGLQRHPAYLSARVTLGRSLIEVNRYEEAQEQLEHVLRAAPENLAAIRGLAEIHHRRGELPEALEHYRSSSPEPAPTAIAPTPAPPPVAPVSVVAAPVATPPAPPVATPATPPVAAPPAPAVAPPVAPSTSPRPIDMPPVQTPARETPPRAETPALPAPAARAAVPISRPATVAMSPRPDPDLARLPALETFLDAILRAKAALPPQPRS